MGSAGRMADAAYPSPSAQVAVAAPPNARGWPPMTVDVPGLGELLLQREDGSAVRVSEAWAAGPAVLVFLRHFG